jgi:uncharacterized SAM-binding protein YcdF (DUF218 family)
MEIFFQLSKILTIFIFPLPLVLLMGFSFAVFIQGWKNKILTLIPLLFLWSFSSFPVCQSLIGSLEVDYPPVKIDQVEQADVIVVLGGMINPISKHDKPELLSSADRLTDAVILFKNKKADYILFSGGSGILFQQDRKEADYAKEVLIGLGVPESKIILESQSRNTRENALYTANILKEKKWDQIILVTSAFHMQRSVMTFRNLKIKTIPFPCDYRTLREDWNWDTIIPSAGALETSTIAIKEWIGLIAYNFAGYL